MLTARARLLAGAGVLLATALCYPASAQADPGPTAGNHVTHPDRDFMGWSDRGAQPGAGQSSVPPISTADTVAGIDVSSWQGVVDWASYWNQGFRFAYVKATESTTYTSSTFSQQYDGSYDVGMIRGAYHFATPDTSSGAVQAQFFVAHGGGWSADGKTLPGTLDIEYNPYGATCYGLSQGDMVNWIRDFTTTYKALTSRDAVIYSTTDWWTTCTGNDGSFGATNPLWVARYASDAGALPAGFPYWTFWQHTSTPLDEDLFSAGYDRLQVFATG